MYLGCFAKRDLANNKPGKPLFSNKVKDCAIICLESSYFGMSYWVRINIYSFKLDILAKFWTIYLKLFFLFIYLIISKNVLVNIFYFTFMKLVIYLNATLL